MYKNVLTIWFKEKIDSFVVGIFNTEEEAIAAKLRFAREAENEIVKKDCISFFSTLDNEPTTDKTPEELILNSPWHLIPAKKIEAMSLVIERDTIKKESGIYE